MTRLEGDLQREPGRDGIRQVDVTGQAVHPRQAAQRRKVRDGEACPVGLGHVDDSEVEQALTGAVERLGQGAEHEGGAVAQPEARGRLPDEVGLVIGAVGTGSRKGEARVQGGAVLGA